MHEPSPEHVAAALEFKRKYGAARCRSRGFRDWVEALQCAWSQGWDDREPNGPLLRQFRNNHGHEWLNQQKCKESI